MNRRLARAAVAGAAVLVVLTLLLLSGRDSGDARPGAGSDQPASGGDPFADPIDDIETVEVVLYFPGAGSRLYSEPREVAASDDSRALAATLVRALIAGPGNDLLTPILAPDTAVGSVLISGEGVAYVDLRSPARPTPPVTGSTQELLTIQSLVQTLVTNVAEIEAIVLLWNGRQPRTFGGHVDTTRPLVPDPELLAS